MIAEVQLMKLLNRLAQSTSVEEFDRLRGRLMEEPQYRFIDKDVLLRQLVDSVIREKELTFKTAGYL